MSILSKLIQELTINEFYRRIKTKPVIVGVGTLGCRVLSNFSPKELFVDMIAVSSDYYRLHYLTPVAYRVEIPESEEELVNSILPLLSRPVSPPPFCFLVADLEEREGKLLPPANILVNGENLSFDSVIIATGTEASAPPIPGLSETGYWTNREALNTRALPHSIAIIGAGVVGVEFAHIFSAFGVPVTIFEIMPDILPGMDREISSTLKRALQKDGVKIYTSCHISRVEKDELFRWHFRVENGEEESLSFEQLLVATGREASFPEGMKRLGIEQEKNRILVNNYLATSNPRFFAAGDIIGGALLAHIAYYEGELAVRNALGANEAVDYTGIPSAIFSTLEIGTAGLSEERAREIAGDGIRVGRFPYSALGRAMAEGKREGFVKLIVDKNDNILGIHAIGEGAGEMLAAFSVAVRNRMKLTSIQETIFAHPTYSEALGEAALAVDGKARHI